MTFYFFDLETSGFRAREDRIMQFGGQRTNMDLEPIGEPDNILIKLTDDVLPQPDAVLVHGILPGKTQADGITEAQFCKYFMGQIAQPDTIMVGYNNIRFDNEFIRFILWRNFYDAYEWSWKDGRSSWDLLDVTRMTRALRPDGIKWPFAPDGKPSNKLELLAAVNKLEHDNAHDALSDVMAVIDLARLIKEKQPKLFDYLLTHRGKDKVAPIVTSGQPFIYTSGRYPSDWQKTTIAAMVAPNLERAAGIVYDLRIDPDEFSGLSTKELIERWQARGEDAPYFPIKQLVFNRCPAIVADMRVLDKQSEKRLGLHMEIIEQHFAKLQKAKNFGATLQKAIEQMNKPYQTEMVVDEMRVDGALYDRFIRDADRIKMRAVRAATPDKLDGFEFADDRLNLLLPLYKARNFAGSLSGPEQGWWAKYKERRLSGSLPIFEKRLSELAASAGQSAEAKHLIGELERYAHRLRAAV